MTPFGSQGQGQGHDEAWSRLEESKTVLGSLNVKVLKDLQIDTKHGYI